MYAGVVRRSLATLIDAGVLVAFLTYVVPRLPIVDIPWAGAIVVLTVVLLYEPILSSRLCTVGQFLMGTRLRAAETFQRLPIGAAYKRFVLKYVASILGAASAGTANVPAGAGGVRVAVWPYGDHRALHDLQVGSVVVKAAALER